MSRIDILLPRNIDVKLWRYMDFLKFVDLLQRRALWFTRLDSFQDKHEGLLPKSVSEALSVLAVVDNAEYGGFTYEKWRKRGCVSCWHINDGESAAMWDLYSTQAGIAVCTRVSRLRDAIQDGFDPGSWGLYGNAVRYVDFGTFNEPWYNGEIAKPVVRAADLHLKRRSFEHEREYRLTTTLEGADENRLGKHVPLCLATMIEEIRVAPTAQDWIVEVVRQQMKQSGLDVRVTKSDLYDAVLQ
jgi:hypothetical protein